MISAQNRSLEPLLTMGSEYDYAEKHLLLVGTGGIKRRPVMEALHALGLGRITCLHDERNWAKNFVDDWIDGDPVYPSEETLQLVKRRAGKLDAVYTYDDYSVILTAFLSERLGLPGIPAAVAQTAKNKAALRELCARSGLPAARFTYCAPGDSDVLGAMERAGVTFPVVLKPAHGAGSVFVRRVNDQAELASQLANYTAALTADPVTQLWPDTGVLVEEYLAGPEVDIDLLIQNGSVRYAAVTDNFAPVEPYFMELGGEIPSALPPPVQSELIAVAARTLHALGAHNLCAHFEARFTARGGVPIEANLRIGGAEVFDFHRMAYGVNLVEGAVRIALGLPVPPLTPDPRCYMRSINVITPRSGTLGEIRPDPWLPLHPGFSEMVFFRNAGEVVRVPPDGFDYIGWVTATGSTRARATQNLREILSLIEVGVGDGFYIPKIVGGEDP